MTRVGRTVGERGGAPVLESGERLDVCSVVWCTGFRPSFDWIMDVPAFGADGLPRHRGGVVEDVPGLYFLGLRYLSALNSSLLGGVGADAGRVVAHRLALAPRVRAHPLPVDIDRNYSGAPVVG